MFAAAHILLNDDFTKHTIDAKKGDRGQFCPFLRLTKNK